MIRAAFLACALAGPVAADEAAIAALGTLELYPHDPAATWTLGAAIADTPQHVGVAAGVAAHIAPRVSIYGKVAADNNGGIVYGAGVVVSFGGR